MITLSRLLNIQPGEGRLVAGLLALSFCLGMARQFTQTVQGTLFLVVFGVQFLPYVYISVAVIIPLIGFGYGWLGNRLALPRLLLLTLGVLLLAVGVLWLNLRLTDARWPVFALSIVFELIWVMTSLCLWSLASSLLNLRQGKRLFSLISAGEVLSATLGGLLTPALVGWFGTLSLLLGTMAGLVSAAVLVRWVTRTFADALAKAAEPAPEEQRPASMSATQRRYILLVIAFTMVSYVGFYCIDNLFYGQVEARYTDEDTLASFLGVFWALVNGLTLAGNLFFVGPFLGRYGVRVGLLFISIVLAIPIALLTLSGTLFGISALIFWLAALANLLNWVFCDTLEKSGILTLYQPLPPTERLRVQTVIESIAQPIAGGVAGLALVLLSLVAFGVVQLGFILLGILAVCIVLAGLLGRRYPQMLLQALTRRKLGSGALALADSDSIAMIMRGLDSPRAGIAIYALDTLEAIEHPALAAALERAFSHPVADIRREALGRAERLRLVVASAFVRQIVVSDADPAVRGAAVRTLAALDGDQADQIAAYLDDPEALVRHGALVGMLRSGRLDNVLNAGERLNRLAASADPAERISAAHALGDVGMHSYYYPLTHLLDDATLAVRRAALVAAGHFKHPQLIASLLDALAQPDTHAQAATALAAYGSPIVPALLAAFAQAEQSPSMTIRLLRVAGRIGGEQALVLLDLAVGSDNALVRHEALLALNRRSYRTGTARQENIPRALQSEIAEMVRLLAAQLDLDADTNGLPTLLDAAIKEAIGDSRERTLLALACVYEPQVIARVRDTLAHPNAEKRAYAIEALDNILTQAHKPLLTLIADDLSSAQRLKRLSSSTPTRLGRDPRLRELATSSAAYTPWIRMCATYQLMRASTGTVLKQHIAALPIALEATVGLAHKRADMDLDGAAAMLSVIEKVLILKTVSIFAKTPDSTLAEVAALLEEQDLSADEQLFEKGTPGQRMYIIVAGRVRVHDGARTLNELGESDIVGEMAVLDSAPRVASVTAIEETRLLWLDQDALYELMADHVDVARGIIQVLSGHLRARVQDVAQLRARVQELEELRPASYISVAG